MTVPYDQGASVPRWAPVIRLSVFCVLAGFLAATLFWEALLG